MKRYLLLFIGLTMALIANAQSYKVSLDATLNDDFKKMKKGAKVNISRVINNIDLDDYGNVKTKYFIVIGKDTVLYDNRISNRFDYTYDDIQDLWDQKIICNVLEGLQEEGIQESLRKEMDEEALDFINNQKEYGMVFNDPYLENLIILFTIF